MSIERIINKIIEDAKAEAEAIVREAEEKRIAELESLKEELTRKSKEIIENAKKDAEAIKQRAESRMMLEKRKRESALKESIFIETLDGVVQMLKKKEQSLLQAVLKKMIAGANPHGEVEIRVSSDLRKVLNSRFLASVSKELDAKFFLSENEPDGADVEMVGHNYSIKLNLRDFLESQKAEISKILFGNLGI